MKRFLVFSGEDYYPAGGAEDFTSAHETRDEAIDIARSAIEASRLVIDGWDHGPTTQWAHVGEITDDGLTITWSDDE